jgi:hypothetical protein
MHTILAENSGLVPKIHTKQPITTCNYSSRRAYALFWLLWWTHTYTHTHTHTHRERERERERERNKINLLFIRKK